MTKHSKKHVWDTATPGVEHDQAQQETDESQKVNRRVEDPRWTRRHWEESYHQAGTLRNHEATKTTPRLLRIS